MMIWTERELDRVRAFRVRLKVDEGVWMEGKNYIGATIARRFCRELEPLRIDERDVRVRVEPLAPSDHHLTRGMVPVVGYWQPESSEVQIRGGERDGEVLAVRDLWRTLVVHQLVEPSFMSTHRAVGVIHLTATGWSEEHRRVVMDWPRVDRVDTTRYPVL